MIRAVVSFVGRVLRELFLMAVILVFLTLAAASTVTAYRRQTWASAMGRIIAHEPDPEAPTQLPGTAGFPVIATIEFTDAIGRTWQIKRQFEVGQFGQVGDGFELRYPESDPARAVSAADLDTIPFLPTLSLYLVLALMVFLAYRRRRRSLPKKVPCDHGSGPGSHSTSGV